MTAQDRRPLIEFHNHIPTMVTVAVAFGIAYLLLFFELSNGEDPPFTLATLLAATGLGVIYLALLMVRHDALEPLLGRHTQWVSYTTLVVLMLVIQFMLGGTYTIWLISMPLVGITAVELPRWPRRLIYVIVLVGFFLIFYIRQGNLAEAFITTLIFSTALVFVIIFVNLTQKAELAQREAERLTAQLADANRRLGDFAVQAEELATTQERNRLAREIHDNLGHYLTAANVQIKAAQALLDKDPSRAGEALEKAAHLTQEGLSAVRHSVSSLRESPLGRLTLPEAITRLADEFQATGLVVAFHQIGTLRPLDPRAELTLYRGAQEGLTNVRKHARASRVDLTLSYLDPAAVSLVVADNGIGAGGGGEASGFGLLGLRERARQLGGRVEATSRPGEGYTLRLELPAAAAAATPTAATTGEPDDAEAS